MLTRTSKVRVLIVSASILLGLLCGKDFFWSINLVLVTGASILLVGAGSILGIIFRSHAAIRTTGSIFLFFLLALFSSYVSREVSMYSATRNANKVIEAIHEYRDRQGHFPESIDNIELEEGVRSSFNKDQHYWVDSARQKFWIGCWSDGWHTKSYYSEYRRWVMED